MSVSRRQFLLSSAAASALAVLDRPVGSLAEALPSGGLTWVRGVCRYCGTGCGLYKGVKDGRLVAVKGDPDNHNRGFLCLKGFLLPQIIDTPDRLLHPLIRKNGTLVRASWDEALDLVARRFSEAMAKQGKDAVAFYGSGQGYSEETYAANKLFKGGFGTNNVEGNPRLCMASAVGGYVTSFGKDEPMGCYEDIDSSDCFFLVGANPAEAHPILFQRIARRKKADPSVKVVVVDPRRTPTSRIADLHLTFDPGTDLAILNSIAHVIVTKGLADLDFMIRHVDFGEGADAGRSWDDYVTFLEGYPPEAAARISGCPADKIVEAAELFAAPGRQTMSMWCMGLNQRTRGVWANNLVSNLHLITGKIGLPGSTPFSLTGQPNACGGVRDGGALSHLLPFGRSVADAGDRAEVEGVWKVPPGTIAEAPGRHCIDMFRALETGDVRCLYVMCTNPGQSLPNLTRYREAMASEDVFLVVSDIYHPTRTTELADVVLPAAAWSEKEGVFGCSERRYQLDQKALEPLGEARPDFDILVELARRTGHGGLLPWTSPAEAWDELLVLASTTPYQTQGITRDRLKKEPGLLWPCPSENHPGTKRRYVRGEDPNVPGEWPTRMQFYGRPDNRAVVWMRPHQPPQEPPDADYPVCFTTGRVIEHWHTGTMTMQCKELEHARSRAEVEIHPRDAAALKVRTGDTVRVTSRRASVEFPALVTETSREGMVFVHMHDPDRLCNEITIDAFDPGSKQPEFKICAVRLEKA